jgi:hypothetical protein
MHENVLQPRASILLGGLPSSTGIFERGWARYAAASNTGHNTRSLYMCSKHGAQERDQEYSHDDIERIIR